MYLPNLKALRLNPNSERGGKGMTSIIYHFESHDYGFPGVILNVQKPNTSLILFLPDTKWQELNQITVDRQQKLEESSNNLTQFQTTEAQLKQWLLEKELMVSVLGPLSIDPNMLNTQRQQVQVSAI